MSSSIPLRMVNLKTEKKLRTPKLRFSLVLFKSFAHTYCSTSHCLAQDMLTYTHFILKRSNSRPLQKSLNYPRKHPHQIFISYYTYTIQPTLNGRYHNIRQIIQLYILRRRSPTNLLIPSNKYLVT
jgi:hypothetical protein